MLATGTRVTVVGEVLVDLLWRYGAREARAVPGGSPANVAVGLHRLARPVTLVTTWGDDAPGALVREHLGAIGVDVRRVADDTARTTVALAHLDDAGGATYDFLASWAPRTLTVPEDTAVLHTGSLAIAVEPGAPRVRELCAAQAAAGRTVVTDLNVRPAVRPDRAAYRAACRGVAAVSRVLKASDEDLGWLFPDLEPVAAARALLAEGPDLAVVTCGAAGALAVTAERVVRVAAPAVSVVDTVGAGDAFQAALLDALAAAAVAGESPPQTRSALAAVLRRCVTAAAITCTRTGADPPTGAELAAAQRRHDDVP